MKALKQDKNFWKRLTKEFNSHADKDDWKHEKSIKVSHTSLFPIHNVGRGPNPNEPTLLDFTTKITEARAIHFHYESKYGSLQIFLNSKTKSSNETFFEVRKNGKNQTFTYVDRVNEDDQFGYFVKELIKSAKDTDYIDTDYIREALVSQGYSILTEFSFTDKVSFRMPHHSGYSINPTYVKNIRSGIEIGWLSSGTYNSIPNVVRIERSNGIKCESLSKLGIERAGYYDHHYKCKILPTQAKAAKSFFKSRFNKGAQS